MLRVAAVLLLLVAQAHAACTYTQATLDDRVEVVLRAGPGRVPCRTVALTAATPLTVSARVETSVGRKQKIKGDDLRALPGGGWEIHAPELAEGDVIRVSVALPAEELQVGLAPWKDGDHVGARLDEVRTITLDPEHPGWGFADEKLASTRVRAAWTFTADAPAQTLPLPPTAGDPTTARWTGGAGERVLEWTEAGAAPQGMVTLPPGSLTLLAPGVEWVTSAGPGVTVSTVPDGVRFDAPTGGVARWRVAKAGNDPVIPDVQTFVAGLTYRFARVSLPEPAVPVRLKGIRDAEETLTKLYEEVQGLTAYQTPGADPLRPRGLNRAYRSGWASAVERGLILHRFAGQEKMPAGWVLTGEAADPATLTGFDHLLLRLTVNDREIWLDPSCRSCAAGEIDARWMGRPAIGASAAVPRQEGLLVRRIRLEGTTFLVRFEATGAAAAWLRERAAELDVPPQTGRLGTALGLTEATVTGWSASLGLPAPSGATLDAPDGTVVLEARTEHAPGEPYGGVPPWLGGWKDEL